MNAKLHIKGFKCFRDVEIPLKQLTIFAGANGQGKSTAIQSILLLRNTIDSIRSKISREDHEIEHENLVESTKISINGNYCLSLGDSHSLLNSSREGEGIVLKLDHNDRGYFSAIYDAEDFTNTLYLNLLKSTGKGLSNAPLLTKEFYYLNAERIGPRTRQDIVFTEFDHVGFYGELTAQVLSEKGGFTSVQKERWFKGTTNKNLEQQVSYWMDFIFPGIRVKSGSSGSIHSAEILLENEYSSSGSLIPTNAGFGISYVLPIIVTGLIAKKKSYFIVENPEAHLHPSAQSRVGRFLAQIAQAGVHILVETHSEHVINGIQISVAEETIDYQFPLVNFFGGNKSNTQPEVESIQLKKNGKLTKWPKGFFDQAQIDYANLLNIQKDV
ncbi:DUF3696 domain-containing protein [Rhodohalobacter sulfatireducens]|uniref:DUF3696 domain-containing protein n=1 Tax=Rhodohalobacter sulfatireducens TaxID=2911366 RepID=A0ABS9KFB5_9BACT|nr:DUF3696 domain-containing protein [Rhodohalobacter sulfatireducens]MCG2589520.1 DUF3696 domain-containing protein [Rhodohalobacter sulfatireducens]